MIDTGFLLLMMTPIGGATIGLVLFLLLPEFREDRDRLKRAVGISGSGHSG